LGSQLTARSKPGKSNSRSVLMLASRPDISGPIPKIVPLQAAMLDAYGYAVDVAYWGSRFDREPTFRKVFAGPRDLARVLEALAAGSFSILFVNTSHDVKTLLRDMPLLWLTRRRNTKRVLLLHGSQADRLARPGSRLFKLASRLLARSADAVLLLSRSELATWRTFEPRGRYFYVMNPFVPGPELASAAATHEAVVGTKREQREVIFVGRLMQEKGVVDLLEATRLVNVRLPCRLTLAGMGPLKELVARRAARQGLADKVVLCGYLDAADLAKAYASADILVLPTYWDEGFPTVIAEAMSVGLPVITTRIRGAADFLADGENCIFAPPRDPKRLAECILTLLEDDGLARRMSAANKTLVEALRPTDVGAAYAEAFESVGVRG
jgi:glycosyltransferase involved in cell wall biosynthesis